MELMGERNGKICLGFVHHEGWKVTKYCMLTIILGVPV